MLSNWKDGCLQGNESDSRGVKREKNKTNTYWHHLGPGQSPSARHVYLNPSLIRRRTQLSCEIRAHTVLRISCVAHRPSFFGRPSWKSQSCPSLIWWRMSVMQSELKVCRWGHLWMLCIKRCQDLYFFHGGLVWRRSEFYTLLVLRFDRVLVQTQSCLIVCSNTVPHLFVFSLREVLVVRDVWKHICGVYAYTYKDLWNFKGPLKLTKNVYCETQNNYFEKRFRLIDLLWVFQPYLWKNRIESTTPDQQNL